MQIYNIFSKNALRSVPKNRLNIKYVRRNEASPMCDDVKVPTSVTLFLKKIIKLVYRRGTSLH